MRTLLIIALLLFPASALPGDVEISEALEASARLEGLRTWRDLDKWRNEFSPEYDDGFYSEGISDFVERKLSADWDSLQGLASLEAESPGIFEFAARHLGEITTCEAAKVIVLSATERCPLSLDHYCLRIQSILEPLAAPQCLPDRHNKKLQPTAKAPAE